MRLFLASRDFGKFADVLHKLAGKNQKVLMITNARDYRPQSYIEELIERKRKLFEEAGFEAEALDLRKFFHRSEKLKTMVDESQAGIIYTLGGNVFLLATAIRLSGMDRLLRDYLRRDQLVYAGGSAGAMVTAPNLQVYNCDTLPDNSANIVREVYDTPPVFDGFGLIDKYIVPHYDVAECAEAVDHYEQQITQIGGEAILLRDADVHVVDGEEANLLRGDD